MPHTSPSLESLTELSTLEGLLAERGLDALLATFDEVLAGTPPDARIHKSESLSVSPRTLQVLRRALAQDAAFLRAHPETLFQCLYNRLRWFDAPDTAPHFAPTDAGPWSHAEAHLWKLAEHWRGQWATRGGVSWVESLRPLPGALEGNDQVLRHDAQVLCAAFSPSGAWLATGSWEDGRNVRIWDVATGTLIHQLAGHEGEVRSVAWSPDGTRLASGSRDHDARIWDVETGALLHAMTRQEGQVTSVAFSPDGRWLAAANLGWRVRLFDVASGRVVRTLEGHEQSVLTVAFHPSGRWLASGASDDTVRIWDLETGTQTARIRSTTSVSSVAFSPDGGWLVLTSMDGLIRVETAGWTRVPGALGQGPYSQVAWLEGARLGALAFNRVELLDASNGDVLRAHPYPSDGRERGAAFLPSGKRFALTAANGRTHVSDLDAAPSPTLLAEQDRVMNLWGHSEGAWGITRLHSETRVIDSRGQATALPPGAPAAYAQTWKVSPDGAWLAQPELSSHERRYQLGILLLDARSLAPARPLLAPPGDQAAKAQTRLVDKLPIAFSPDGQLLAAAIQEGAVHLWRVADGTLLHRLRGPGGPITWVDFTPDGTCVVSGHAASERVYVHEVRSGKVVVNTEAVVDPSPAYAAAASAPLIAVGRASGELALITIPTGAQQVLTVSPEPVISLGLSADGTRVAACSLDECVRVFDVRTGARLHELPHPALPFSVAMSGEVLVTLANDMHTRVFDLATGELRTEFAGSVPTDDVVSRRYWETLGEGPVTFHLLRDTTPRACFPDAMEEILILKDGLVLGRGRTERDFLYVLKLHMP
ncbi:High-affnity carbon uptake protein Hat/HatR [Myxococcus xanthus]|uniref:High-affnity carbon uptake protein Hat/HatR n=1 Tax=Myxococcus xanthus TaxID=34 RepID=A0AAE6KRC4_MYXXA|nr:WD40 repeat domain-containing protein [Myxococcus xanthus]QDE66999.1 High-affnity carbon uptake protein Hat/HatR [Myxococcus xanthus]QDE74272.1 High-affnity carbon uptake protein Hat/HatR [Myxococcus xanthus]